MGFKIEIDSAMAPTQTLIQDPCPVGLSKNIDRSSYVLAPRVDVSRD